MSRERGGRGRGGRREGGRAGREGGTAAQRDGGDRRGGRQGGRPARRQANRAEAKERRAGTEGGTEGWSERGREGAACARGREGAAGCGMDEQRAGQRGMAEARAGGSGAAGREAGRAGGMEGRGRKGGNEGGGMEEAGRDGRRDGRKGERAAGGRRAVLRPPDAQPPLTAASDASSQGEASRRRDRARPRWSECRSNQARFQRTRRCRSCARREQQLSMLPAFAPSRSAGRLSREVSERCGAPANLATGCKCSRCVCCCRRLATAAPMLVGRPWAAGAWGRDDAAHELRGHRMCGGSEETAAGNKPWTRPNSPTSP